ncbi:hypothetical protein [Vibrio phage vB_VpaS_CHI]|nr:hypothetical protein [Vibrio phage vB_VpaS_ALK]USL90115.1 hypothetical protein [Vibrio phage vB_VpaS_CHI]
MNKQTALLIVICISLIMLAVGQMETQDEAMALENYCQMVELYKQSDGEHGWPDYDGIYESDCANR